MRKLSFTIAAIALTKTHRVRFADTPAPLPIPTHLNDVGQFQFRSREEQITKILSDPNYDILIVGGGATGAGSLLSASRKGFKTLLIDSNDFAAGTSSKSTKLLHGGLRYLENAFKLKNKNRREDFHLVNEALNERDVLLNNVPYLSDQVGLVIPLTNIWKALYYYSGCVFYHQFAKLRRKGLRGLFNNDDEQKFPFQVSAPQLLTRTRMESLVPTLGKQYKYGVLLFDGQSDDSSMVIDCILTATSLKHPALKQNEALNYASLVGFIKNEQGQVTGARIFDKIKKKEFEVKFKVAINATGIFGDKIKQLANPDAPARLSFAKGDHIALNNANGQFLPLNQSNIGVFIPSTKDGRVMFVLPWKETVIAGTTDKVVAEPVINPVADAESVGEILESVTAYFPTSPVNVESKWSGIRPLVKDLEAEGESSAKASGSDGSKVATKDLKRVHLIELDKKSGLISVYGGKLTIFRKMGEDAIEEAAKELKRKGAISEEVYTKSLEKSTENLRFIGDYREKLYGLSNEVSPLADEKKFATRETYMEYLRAYLQQTYRGIEEDIIEHLLRRYGQRAVIILNEMEKDPSKRMRLKADRAFTKGEIEHIIRNEFVERPVDLVVRRLRISFTDSSLAKELLPSVIDIFGEVRGWDTETRNQEFKFNSQMLDTMGFETDPKSA